MSTFWSITFGNVLTIVGMVMATIIFIVGMRGKIDTISAVVDTKFEVMLKRIEVIETNMKTLVQVLVDQGRAEERMVAVQQQLNQQAQRLDTLSERFTFWLNGRARQAVGTPPDDRL